MKRLILLSSSISIIFSFTAIAQSSDAALTTQANVIRNETAPGGNTKTRIADMYQGIIDSKVSRIESYSTTGTNAYSVTIPWVTSYQVGLKFWVLFQNSNTSAVTLNVSTLGARNVYKGVTTPLASGDISAGQVLQLFYDGTNFQVLNISGAGGGGIPGGADGNVQYKNGSSFAGSNNLFWDDANSRLGIGTATPSTPLQVVGTITATRLFGTSGSTLDIESAASQNIKIKTGSGGNFTLTNATNVELLKINESGQVSIGVVTPSSLLDVAGTITGSVFTGPSTNTAFYTSATGQNMVIQAGAGGNLSVGNTALNIVDTGSKISRNSPNTISLIANTTRETMFTDTGAIFGGNSITANTAIDVRGISAGNILRLANSANTQRFLVSDAGDVSISNLTTNGIVTTSGGTGTLGVTSVLPVANGGTGITNLNPRAFITSQVIATDANITASAGQSIVATANLFTANRTIDLSGLNQDNDYLEIYLGSSQNFNLSPTGQLLYFSDDVNTVTNFLTQLHYQIRRKNGRLYIIN